MPFDFNTVKDFIRCPECRGELVQDGERLVCVNPENRLSYPVKDGIPILLREEATQLSDSDWSAALQRAGRVAP